MRLTINGYTCATLACMLINSLAWLARCIWCVCVWGGGGGGGLRENLKQKSRK